MIQPEWQTAKEYEDITYKKCNGVARIAFNRPNVRNAFRPKTTKELYDAFYDAGEDINIGVVLLSAEGPSSKDGVYSFCSGLIASCTCIILWAALSKNLTDLELTLVDEYLPIYKYYISFISLTVSAPNNTAALLKNFIDPC